MNAFEKNILNIYREKGKAWLAELPELVQQLANHWSLSDLKPYEYLSFNYVLFGYQKGKPIVLKLSLDASSLEKEAKALEVFTGYGAVSVLECKNNALLMQRAIPGISLKNLKPKDCQDALEIACHVIEKLHQAPLPQQQLFPCIEDWLAALDKEVELSPDLLHKARKLKNQLLQTQTSRVLLHGDLHRDNILFNDKDWLVIDPKGVIGFPINELWACIEDPNNDLKYISKYFNYHFDDVVKWYYVHLILAACWQIEDHLDPKIFLARALSVLPMIKD